jgi:hypothetical protein
MKLAKKLPTSRGWQWQTQVVLAVFGWCLPTEPVVFGLVGVPLCFATFKNRDI